MCYDGTSYAESQRRRAAIDLASDIAKHLKVDVDPDRLAAYLNSRWFLVAPLAHAIHIEKATEPEYFNEVELGASHAG